MSRQNKRFRELGRPRVGPGDLWERDEAKGFGALQARPKQMDGWIFSVGLRGRVLDGDDDAYGVFHSFFEIEVHERRLELRAQKVAQASGGRRVEAEERPFLFGE